MDWLEKLVYAFTSTGKMAGSYYCFIYLLRDKKEEGLARLSVRKQMGQHVLHIVEVGGLLFHCGLLRRPWRTFLRLCKKPHGKRRNGFVA